jgi:gamma-glutamyltranspeptidase
MEVHNDAREAIVERDVSAVAREALEHAGYALEELEPHDESVGHAHLIRVTDDGSFDVGTDPRADGEVAVR